MRNTSLTSKLTKVSGKLLKITVDLNDFKEIIPEDGEIPDGMFE
jgi:hypothetical protein